MCRLQETATCRLRVCDSYCGRHFDRIEMRCVSSHLSNRKYHRRSRQPHNFANGSVFSLHKEPYCAQRETTTRTSRCAPAGSRQTRTIPAPTVLHAAMERLERATTPSTCRSLRRSPRISRMRAQPQHVPSSGLLAAAAARVMLNTNAEET
jgi:hypothetical protein